ncbi:MAG TPA: choice-of-anchor D domain-containing protein [Candidatus Sulfotelmatobacter sp.]|nr:choice-of-anchor D domain-containing protein [Candidatus Sulfotelmatobacter sp.]
MPTTSRIQIVAAIITFSVLMGMRGGSKPNGNERPSTMPALAAEYGRLPLSFEENKGQTASKVKFLTREPGYTLFLTGDEAVLALRQPSDSQTRVVPTSVTAQRPSKHSLPASESALRIRLIDANDSAKVSGMDQASGHSNYFIGSNSAQWRTDVPTFARVKYEDVYPGIDLVYYGNRSGRLEHDFVVKSGADANSIALALDGADRVQVNPDGDLVISIGKQLVTLERPVLYQVGNGEREPVSGSYQLVADNQVRFAIGSYDHSRSLVIDPVLIYSTFLGGGNGVPIQGADAIAVDASGNTYITGHTETTNFPTTSGSFQPTCNFGGGCSAVFVTKLNAAGSALVYSTYLGGSLYDEGYAIAVDASGNAYIAGKAESSDFPTTAGAFQTKYPGKTSSAFVSKLNATGSSLVYSTFLGGSGGGLCYLANGSQDDLARGIAVDASGNAYVTGCTDSTNFPTTSGAYDKTCHACSGHGDAFVTKLNATGTGLVYSTYLGGSTLDVGYSIAVDASGNAYVGGSATSADFPVTSGAFQTTKAAGGQVGFITKVNTTGSGLVYSTFLGGSTVDLIYGIALDSSTNVYATGYASSTNFPTTTGAYQKTCKDCASGFSSFVTKLNSTGKTLGYSTYLGGSGSDIGIDIAVNASGNAFVTGQTSSTDFPTVAGAFQTTCHDCSVSLGSSAAFVTEMNPTGTALTYSTFLGGSKTDQGMGIALDAAGNAYIAGTTGSTDFPVTKGAFDVTCNGCLSFGTDAFITKFSFAPPTTATVSPTSLTFASQAIGTTSAAKTVTLTDTGTSALDILSITITGTNAGDFVQTNTCGTSVAAGKTCTINVGFKPTGDGTRTATLTVNDNTTAPQTVALSGTGTGTSAAAVTLTPTSLTFASQTVNTTSAAKTVTVKNTGTASLSLTSITFTGADPTQFTGSTTCTTTLAAGASCTISVEFKPTFGGPQTASVSIADNATGSPQTVALSGSGLGPGAVFTPTSVTFPAQVLGTTSTAVTVTLKNNGTTALGISAAGLVGTNYGDFTGTTNCPTSLAAGASCTFSLQFKPTAIGSRTASLEVVDNTGSGSQLVALTGTGTEVKLSATSLAFGTQTVGTTSAAKTVTVTNVGAAAMSISGVKLAGTNPGDFTETNTCGTSLGAGKSCTITVTFKPTAKGARSASVSLTDNGGSSPTIALSGTGA